MQDANGNGKLKPHAFEMLSYRIRCYISTKIVDKLFPQKQREGGGGHIGFDADPVGVDGLGMWRARVVQSEQHMICRLKASGGQGGPSKHGRN